jgi:hypothetical protein
MQIERGDIAGIVELVGLERINGVWNSVCSWLGRLEGSLGNNARVADVNNVQRLCWSVEMLR